MKIAHLSDLHLGKRVNEYPMIEDQQYILQQIKNILVEENPDCVLIAGDIYDKSVPSTEAVELFDEFLVSLASESFQVLIIGGNHDSQERLAFGNRIMDYSGIHISPVYRGCVKPYSFKDEYGDVLIYPLPFIKPQSIRQYFPESEIKSYNDAMKLAIEQMNIDTKLRNVLVAHQFVTGAERSDSEVCVGSIDNIDASVFDGFDYVALGHIHGPQNIGSKRLRYCGTPLKYSLSEVNHNKSITIVELAEKGELDIREIPLVPLHDMREIVGRYDEIMKRSFYENTTFQEDYVYIKLTDDDPIPNVVQRLHTVYHNMMDVKYDNTRTRVDLSIDASDSSGSKTPLELFCELYSMQNGKHMSDEQKTFVQNCIEKVWEDEQ